jgi:hypothetical protein
MENSATSKRRIKIIIGYIVLFCVIAFILYLILSPAATCFDKKQNQGEKGIDCGGPCTPCKDVTQTKDISIGEVAFALGGNNTYDVVAKISNPNDATGAKTFNYVFTLKDSSGLIIAKREGTNFILPADTKYVAELGLQTDNNVIPASANIEISGAVWDKLSNVDKPQIGVYDKNFSSIPDSDGSQAEGTIRNESNYDLKQIDITIVLRDEKGNIIGVSTTQRNSVRANEDQSFKVTWPYSLGGNVQKMEVDPQANVFD